MLQRIISIKNVGRFRSSAAVGDVTFRRVTLIFAENGRGKTTFCAILREIEEVLAGLPPVREAAVAGVPDLRRGEVQTHLLPPPEPRP